MASESEVKSRDNVAVVQVEDGGRGFRILQTVVVVPNKDADVGKDRMGDVATNEWAGDGVMRGGGAEHRAARGRGWTRPAAKARDLRDGRTGDCRSALNAYLPPAEGKADRSAEISVLEAHGGVGKG